MKPFSPHKTQLFPKSLNFKPNIFYLSNAENISYPVMIAIEKFKNHSSAQPIKLNTSIDQNFIFSNTSVSDILVETTSLNIKRNETFDDISTKSLRSV